MQIFGSQWETQRFYNYRVNIQGIVIKIMHDYWNNLLDLSFHPPGQLSAGLTCEFNITFEPKVFLTNKIHKNKKNFWKIFFSQDK